VARLGGRSTLRAVGRSLLVPGMAVSVVTGCSSAAGSPAGAVVDVSASEYRFDPSAISVPTGPVTFKVTNNGTVAHEFELERNGQTVDEVEDILPGLERDLTVTLAAGQYEFVCALPGHEEQGMKGTLTVR